MRANGFEAMIWWGRSARVLREERSESPKERRPEAFSMMELGYWVSFLWVRLFLVSSLLLNMALLSHVTLLGNIPVDNGDDGRNHHSSGCSADKVGAQAQSQVLGVPS